MIDVDAHYLEPVDELPSYMEEPIRSQIGNAKPESFIPGSLGDALIGGRIKRPEFQSGYRDPGARIDLESVKARLGIDAFVLVPNGILNLSESNQRRVVTSYQSAYVDYMLEKVADPAKGTYIVIPVSWQDPEAGAALVHRTADNPAVVAVNLGASTVPLGDERFSVLYQAAQDHGLPILFHAARGASSLTGAPLVGDFQELLEGQTVGFAVSNIVQLTSILVQGIPERFPKLKFIFEESGIFWIPLVMYRLDQYFLKRRSEAPLLKKLPSEYVRECCYFGTQPIEAPKESFHLQAVIEMVGADRLLYASDYPHWDYDDAAAITGLDFLSASDKAAILGGNARKAFDFRRGGEQPWERTGSRQLTSSPTVAG